MSHSIAFVIATKDRPQELRRLLRSIENQSCQPNQIIIVDGGDKITGDLMQEFPLLSITYLRYLPPSAARQRNWGIQYISAQTTLVGFFDDDIILEANSLAAMMDFWKDAQEDIAGAGFNMTNTDGLSSSRLKSLALVNSLGLYSDTKGFIAPSGFQALIGYAKETIFVRWLPTCAVVWRRKAFEEFKFDPWFSGYSYLEDLDFSYRVGKKYRLAVVADAKYYHYLVPGGRENSYQFGKKEVVNRVYFVMKNPELSLFKCYLALLIRMLISLSLGIRRLKITYFQRAGGNLVGLYESTYLGKKSKI